MIFEKLNDGVEINWAVLQARARRHLRERNLRAALREQGLTDEEIDELLRDFPGD